MKYDANDPERFDYLGASASTTDCTGLIPSGPVTKEDLDAYECLYPFEPPLISPANKHNPGELPSKQEKKEAPRNEVRDTPPADVR